MVTTDTVVTRTIYPLAIEVSNLISPEHSLRVALVKIQKRSTVRPIFTAWPMLEETTRKLARILTHGFPNNHRNGLDILASAILAAIAAYEKISTNADNETDLADAYIRALIEEASNLVCFDVHGLHENGKSERWEHLSIPLIDWAKKRKFERLVFSARGVFQEQRERGAARMLLACQTLNVRETARLYGAEER